MCAFITMWFASLAQVNIGIITVIWSINPLYMALTDYLIFNKTMYYYHHLGTLLIVSCTVLLALSPMITGQPIETDPHIH